MKIEIIGHFLLFIIKYYDKCFFHHQRNQLDAEEGGTLAGAEEGGTLVGAEGGTLTGVAEGATARRFQLLPSEKYIPLGIAVRYARQPAGGTLVGSAP